MRGRLRVRRLTLAPAALPELLAAGVKKVEEEERIIAEERLSRAIEITHLSSPVTRPHVHGVEDRIGTCFWARGSDPELEEETDEESEQEDDCESVSSPEFIRRAMELGFTVPKLLQAENEMPSPTSQVPIVEGSIAAKILNTMVKHASSKPARRPWRGPLPPPRVSPK